ncbi:MAG: TIGR03663 family protein [Anaerolineales bacterium]|nr:TIGR03663 family protein [Anaerolineales bacterium]
MATTTSTRQQPFDHVLARVYSLNWEAVIYTAILILAVLSRFWDLGLRVMSHDESLHTYYSWELYEYGRFDHTPLMHGPLLFHATAFFYFLFGPSDFSARIYPALLGVALVMFPLLFRRWLGKVGAVLAAVGILISPMILYYSRYIRHDIPSMFFAMVMLYATLQYLDGEKPRRPIWIPVFSGALLLMLASKEVSFMYVAIFGSFLTLYWLLRLVQDIMRGAFRQPVDADATAVLPPRRETPPWWLYPLAYLVILAGVGILGYTIGGVWYEFYKTDSGLISGDLGFHVGSHEIGPDRVLQLYGVLIALAIVEFFGLIRIAFNRRGGLPITVRMVTNAIYYNTRSTMLLVAAGAIVGSVMALWGMVILDIVKPATIFIEAYDPVTNALIPKLAENQLNIFMEWTIVPLGFLVFSIVLIGIIKRATWQDIVALLVIAFVFMSILLVLERHSHPSDETNTGPVAIDPNAEDVSQTLEHDNAPIFLTWVVLSLAVTGVLITRLLTNWWDVLNRQPAFDILIVMGSMVFPWLAAFPLFWAGYTLDQAPLPLETVQAAIVTAIPFLMVSAAVGLAWNWRVWPIAAAAFGVLFLVFFTTFFTNGNGIGTGLIGSLGYWLEQQDVRRGSQPQYYYVLVQLPVYEFLPSILAAFAGFAGVSHFFDFRYRSRQQAMLNAAAARAAQSEQAEGEEIVVGDEPILIEADEVLIDESNVDSEDSPAWVSPEWGQREGRVSRYAYNPEQDRLMSETDHEYLGSLPFLALVGYWGILILVALTMAGEKMPWLTTHLSLPLTLAGGWYIGSVVERIRWDALKRSGWILLLFVVPVFLVALSQLALPYATGNNLPFQGQTQMALDATGRWISALIALAITGYFGVRLTADVGFDQARRLFIGAFALLLAMLTVRAAWLFTYINYDYPTEFGVYAHAGPAVKDVVADLMYFADHSPEGMNIHVAYDDDSSWPMLWYLRDFTDKRYLWGTGEDVKNQIGNIEGALVVIAGNRKNTEIERILGKDYYRFDLIRLWWPMQEYFNLNADRITNIFEPDDVNPSAKYYRQSLWDIWWERDYGSYATALCVERETPACYIQPEGSTDPDERVLDPNCVQRITNSCRNDPQFNIERWPVSDELYMYVRKDFAVQIWDAGLRGQSVAQRLIPDPEDTVYQEINAQSAFGVGELLNPRDLASDTDGYVYAADTGNHRIVKFAPDGTSIDVFGGPEILNEPWGIAVGPHDGNIYVADTWNHRIVIYSPTGEMVGVFGTFGTPDDGGPMSLYGPRDVAVDNEGNIFVADTGGHRIRVYDANYQHLYDITAQGNGLQAEPEPVGLAIHPVTGELYVAETWNQKISAFRRDGTFVMSWDVNMWAGARNSVHRPYLSISPDGTLILVSDMDASESNNGPRVVAYDLRGGAVLSFNTPLVPPDGFPQGMETVGGIAFGKDGQVYVADPQTSRIIIFPPLGISGGLAPIPDPLYVDDGTEIGSTAETDATDVRVVREVGYAYWQALTTGNFDLYNALFCAEDKTQADYPIDAVAFQNLVAQPYLGADFRELEISVELAGNSGTINWGGVMVFKPGTETQSEVVASGYPSLHVVKQGESWQICRSQQPAEEQPSFFRPGGG